jgi:hypothetical protein
VLAFLTDLDCDYFISCGWFSYARRNCFVLYARMVKGEVMISTRLSVSTMATFTAPRAQHVVLMLTSEFYGTYSLLTSPLMDKLTVGQ